MGTVYLATDAATDRRLAIKSVVSFNEPMRLALEREGHLLAQLDHPALPDVVDCFSEEQAHYLAMTYFPGVDLAEQLTRRATPFPLEQVLDWADQLLDVLAYLHTRNPTVVHRDVKPRNLKLTADGRLVLLDFGLAKGHAGLDGASFAGYTVAYAPPEQVRGEGTEPRSDLFALGATLYELLTRKLPPNCMQRLAAISAGEADPLRSPQDLNPAISPALGAVIVHSLALQPAGRPPTAPALRFALQEAKFGDVTVFAPTLVTNPSASATTRPTGTVALLATELVSPASADIVARHDAVLRAVIDAHGAYVFRTGERGLHCAFETADAALGAAVAAQRALQTEPWNYDTPVRIRMALHAGAVEIVGGDYVGPVVPRLTRLLAAGHSGQTLLAETVRDLLCDRLPNGVGLRDLGEHNLAQLAEPVHVYQVEAHDLPSEFPPLMSRAVRSNELPVARTQLIGREHEVSRLAELLRRPSSRLITLIGTGGTGKTRLALAVAESLLDDFADGVHFVPLSAHRDPTLVTAAIAHSIGVQESPGRPLLKTLTTALRDRRVLLVLDNFEQVTSAGADIRELLAGVLHVKVLVTSRTPLRVEGEHTFPVPSLTCPPIDRMPAQDDLARFPAIELYVARAREARRDFVLTTENAAAVACICTRLDGLPLAIELAASQARYFDPDDLLSSLEQRLPVLAAGDHDRPPRHQTLRSTLAWSFELLSQPDQQLFARLGAFAGGFDLESAVAVCGAPDDAGLLLVEGLARLAEHCLLQRVVTPSGEHRYSMLETVREYAAERLGSVPACLEIQQRHASHFLALAEDGDAAISGPTGDAWLARLANEHDNLRAALAWLSQQSPAEPALQLAGALWRFWQVQGHLTEGRAWLGAMLDRPDTQPSAARARALVGAGALAWRQHDTEHAGRLLAEAVRVAGLVDKPSQQATALKHLGLIALYADPPDYLVANTRFEESLAIRRALSDLDGMASNLNDLANVAFEQREFARAGRLLDESLALCREMGNRYGLSFVLHNLSLVALELGDDGRAAELLHECLELAVAMNSLERIGCELWAAGCVAAVRGRSLRAATLFGGAAGLTDEAGARFSAAELATLERMIAPARATLGTSTWDEAVAAGRARTVDELVSEALFELTPDRGTSIY